MLVEQRERGEGSSSLAARECDAEHYSASSSPAAGSQIQVEPRASSVSPPRHGFQLSSVMSPVQQNNGDGVASPPGLDLVGKRRHESCPSEEFVYSKSSSSRDGDKGSFQERREQSGVASSERVGENGSLLSSPGGARSSQIKVFRGQRDNLARSACRVPEEGPNVPAPGQR